MKRLFLKIVVLTLCFSGLLIGQSRRPVYKPWNVSYEITVKNLKPRPSTIEHLSESMKGETASLLISVLGTDIYPDHTIRMGHKELKSYSASAWMPVGSFVQFAGSKAPTELLDYKIHFHDDGHIEGSSHISSVFPINNSYVSFSVLAPRAIDEPYNPDLILYSATISLVKDNIKYIYTCSDKSRARADYCDVKIRSKKYISSRILEGIIGGANLSSLSNNNKLSNPLRITQSEKPIQVRLKDILPAELPIPSWLSPRELSDIIAPTIPARIVELTANIRATNKSNINVAKYIFKVTTPPKNLPYQRTLRYSYPPNAVLEKHENRIDEYLQLTFPIPPHQTVTKH